MTYYEYDAPIRRNFLRPALENVLRPCLRCGHDARAHRLVFPAAGLPDPDGGLIHEARIGGCDAGAGTLLECGCSCYEPDRLSRVSEILGLDVRKVVGV